MDPFDLNLWPGFVHAGGDTHSPAIVDQIAIDSRRVNSKQALFVALPGQVEDGHSFVSHAAAAGARYALVHHQWKAPSSIGQIKLLRVENPLKAFQEIAGTYRKQQKCTVIGICGSYGKTMVKDLLQTMVSTSYCVAASPESFNSQIGVPLSLLTMTKSHQIALIEAAISQKDEMDILREMISPDYGMMTHVGKKHLTTLEDLSTAAKEMSKLLQALEPEKWTILPNDTHLPLDKIKAHHHYWTERSPHLPHAYYTSSDHSTKMNYRIDFPDQNYFEGEISSGFYYFLDLINMTSKAAWLLGISAKDISQILSQYTPEPTRTEIWKSPTGTTFINTPYCSDPQSVDKALKHFEQTTVRGKKVFLFGGMKGKQEQFEKEYRRIGEAIIRSKIDVLALTGSYPFPSLIDEVSRRSPQTEITHYPTLTEALPSIRSSIKSDDLVLVQGEKKINLDILTEAFNDSICSNQCVINLAAIEANIATFRKKLPAGNRIMVMVKALAYGTDEVRMAHFLATCGIDILGVSYVDEGVALRRAGATQSIFAINAAIYEVSKVVKWELEIGVSEKDLINALAKEAQRQNKRIRVHLHVDTGMSRFGCRPELTLELARQIIESPSLELVGIMTHFACADNPDDDHFTLNQAEQFENVVQQLSQQGIFPQWIHAANSSATARFDFLKFNMVRIGLAVFGLYSSDATKNALDLKLALSLNSRIVGINECKKGETISYGRSYTVQKEHQRIAVLPIGYFDGLHRNYSGKGVVVIRGQKALMVGHICMDFMMVDVTDIPNAAIGDPVLIFGEDEYGHYLSPEDLAFKGDSIIHELITCLGPRIQRIFVHEEARFNR